ncbi:MAG: glycoside hydrolase family 127 protein [Phycisphaerales bacterium]
MRIARLSLVVLVTIIALAAAPDAAPRLLKLTPVPFTNVTIEDRFWAPRRATNRDVSIAHSFKMLEEFGNIANLDLAASNARAGYHGPVFADSDLYKVLESASYLLAERRDPALEAQVDAIIERIAKAQRDDGYIDTWYEVNAPDRRFTNLRDDHELYCAGHMYEAAVAHHQATGKRTLLDVATKHADLLCRTFGSGPGQRMGYCGHPEIELALVKLWRETGERRYFDLAKFFVDHRGSGFFADEHKTPKDQYDGRYWQDNAPIRDQRCIVGHAVRAGYLMSGALDVAVEIDDEALLSAIGRVWRNLSERNMFITGGMGPSGSNEGFTEDFDLPTATAYQETCASVALAMWNHRLALATGDTRYADLMETSLYNGILAGVSLDGTRFFYVNPLASEGGHHRSEWFGCACCPPNVTRTLAALGGYAYATGHGALWVNLYIQGSVKANVDGVDVSMRVTTDYPWDGRVTFEIEPAREQTFGLRLRVPAWCDGASVRVNGAPAPLVLERGYAVIDRAWKKGDRVELDLPMPPRRVASDPRVAATRGEYALARGPLVYCVEKADLDASLERFALPVETPLATTKRDDVLGGVVTIDGEGLVAGAPSWDGGLYRTAVPPKRVRFSAVPYYAWDNRAPGPMRVWLPTAPQPPMVRGAEQSANLTLSSRSGYAQPEGVRDGVEPRSSGEQPARLCHFWPNKGPTPNAAGAIDATRTEWIEYAWKEPVTLGGVRVYWFDDTGRGECRLPKAARVLYRDGDAWKPLPGGALPIELDRWCELRSGDVTTTALRLEMDLPPGFSVGVHEWKVLDPDGANGI